MHKMLTTVEPAQLLRALNVAVITLKAAQEFTNKVPGGSRPTQPDLERLDLAEAIRALDTVSL